MSLVNINNFLIKNSGLGGYDLLSASELEKFVDGLTDTNAVTITSQISLYIDLFSAYKISEIRYYRSGTSTITIEISQNGVSWDTVSYDSYAGYVSVVDVFSEEDYNTWPRYIRINHAKVSADVYGYEVVIISKDFENIGYLSLSSEETVETDNSVPSEITELAIYNKSSSISDIYCLLEPEGDYDPTGVALSTTSSGYYNRIYEKGLKFPRDASWSSGLSFGLVESGTGLATETASGTGYYYSPVFDISSLLPVRLYFEYSNISGSTLDWNNSQDDSGPTVGVRLYNDVPDAPWESGTLPSEEDSLWGTQGSLSFVPSINNAVFGGTIGRGKYFQVAVKFITPVLGYSSILTSVGLEESTVLSGVGVNSYSNLYIKTNISGSSQSSSVNLLSFLLD